MSTSAIDLFEELFGIEEYQVSNSGTEIKKKCPECGRKALNCNIEIGAYRCFTCGFGGYLKNFKPVIRQKKVVNLEAQRKILDFIISQNQLSPELESYLVKRGIPNPKKFRLSSVQLDTKNKCVQNFSYSELLSSGLFSEEKLKPHLCISLGRIIIPYYLNNQIQTIKSRSNPNDIMNLNNIKYAFPPGSHTNGCLYIPGKSFGGDLVITEGELKAICVYISGINAVSFSGQAFSPQSLALLKKCVHRIGVQRLFIIFDSDPPVETNWALLSNTTSLYNEFGSIACMNFLPHTDQKVDLDSFLLENRKTTFFDFLEDSWQNRKQLGIKWNTALHNCKPKR